MFLMYVMSCFLMSCPIRTLSIMTLLIFLFLICELPWLLEKDSEVDSHCVVFLLNWLLPSASVSSLWYLTHSFGQEGEKEMESFVQSEHYILFKNLNTACQVSTSHIMSTWFYLFLYYQKSGLHRSVCCGLFGWYENVTHMHEMYPFRVTATRPT